MRTLGERRGFMQRLMMAVVGASALVIACDNSSDNSPTGPSVRDFFEDDDRAFLDCGNPDQSGNLCGYWRGEVPGMFDQFINRCQRACVASNAGEDVLRQLCMELDALARIPPSPGFAGPGPRAHCGNVPNRWGNRADQCIPCDEFARRSPGPTTQNTQGWVVFYTKASRGWSSIRVLVDGEFEGTLMSYRTSDFDQCPRSSSRAHVVAWRNPGTYRYQAESNRGASWSGSVTFYADDCRLVELTCSDGDCN